MRYFEIAKPRVRHTPADADQRDAAGEPRSGRLRDRWGLGYANSWSRSGRHCTGTQALISRQSRRRHL